MVHTLAYTLVFGKPLVMYMGIATLFLFLCAATIPLLTDVFQVHVVPFRWHPRIAITALVFGVLHGILGLSLYLNF